MLISELESLNETKGFVDISSNWKIIDCHLPQLASLVYHKQASEAQSFILLENTISTADGHIFVCKQRHSHVTKTTLLPRLLAPGKVGEVGVSGAGYEGAAQSFKLSHPVIEGNDLCGADKGEVKGVEEENHILSSIVGEADLLKLPVDNSSALELWGLHLWLQHRHGGLG